MTLGWQPMTRKQAKTTQAKEQEAVSTAEVPVARAVGAPFCVGCRNVELPV